MKKPGRLIAEFFLIVVGVLVALMLETALEDRENENLRQEYLSRIKTDFETDKEAIEYRVEFYSRVEEFARQMLIWLDSDAQVDKELLMASFYSAELWPFLPSTSTYQDLQNTGNIRLLDDIGFRTSLATYFNQADIARPGWNPPQDYRAIIRGIIPIDIQAHIRTRCPTTVDLDMTPTGFPPCELPDIDYDEVTAIFAPLRSDPEFRRVLIFRISELGVLVNLARQQAESAGKVLALIDEQ